MRSSVIGILLMLFIPLPYITCFSVYPYPSFLALSFRVSLVARIRSVHYNK
ncbi:hypothetical protein PZA11_003540 [Diplocarpon coronariae]